jgi:sugar lactone lactonase YvrE
LILYELVTLERPHDAVRDGRLVEHIRQGRLARPRRLDRQIPTDLDAILRKATSALPDERYGTADALAADLTAFLEGRPIAARAPRFGYVLRLLARRNPLATGILVASLCAIAVLTALYLGGLLRAQRAQERQLYLAQMAAAAGLIEENAEAARTLLAGAPVRYRGWEWHHMTALADQTIDQTPGFAGTYWGDHQRPLTYTRDGRWLVFTRGDRLVLESDSSRAPYELEIEGGGRFHVEAGTTRVVASRPSGEGVVVQLGQEPSLAHSLSLGRLTAIAFDEEREERFVGRSYGAIDGFHLDGSRVARALPWHDAEVWALDVEDGVLVSGSGNGEVGLHELATGRSRTVHATPDPVWSICLAGELLFAGTSTGTIRGWRLSDLSPLGDRVGHTDRVTALAADPDRDLLVSSSFDGTIRLWSLRDGLHRGVRHGHSGHILDLDLRPGSSRFVSYGVDGTLRRWDLWGAGGEVVLPAALGSGALTFHPDSRLAAMPSGDTTLFVWDTWFGRLNRILWGQPARANALAFSPDGALLYAADLEGAVHAWDIQRSERRLLLDADRGRANAANVLVHPSGRRLFVSNLGAIAAIALSDGTAEELRRIEVDARDVVQHPSGSTDRCPTCC